MAVKYKKAHNKKLHQARKKKYDEFYTRMSDINEELYHYKDQFRGKVIYCNADDPRVSNFFKYFAYQFDPLGLKKLITTCYKNTDMDLFSKNRDAHGIAIEYTGTPNPNGVPGSEDLNIIQLKGDGDFRSPEAIEYLKQADIVVTNPPFSLFREYMQQIMHYNKKFLILGTLNVLSYKEIFPLIKEEKIWTGYNKSTTMSFMVSEEYARDNYYMDKGKRYVKFGNIVWFTNLDVTKRRENLILYRKYDPILYPKYDNYNAINVDKVSDIPYDYDGVMGVPITFLLKHNPDQFEILGNSNIAGEREHLMNGVQCATDCTYINGKPQYARIFIKHKKEG